MGYVKVLRVALRVCTTVLSFVQALQGVPLLGTIG